MSDIEKLKKKTQKLSAMLDFYNDLSKRKIAGEKELKDSKIKLEFAKKQMLKLCMEGKKIIKETEHKDMI